MSDAVVGRLAGLVPAIVTTGVVLRVMDEMYDTRKEKGSQSQLSLKRMKLV